MHTSYLKSYRKELEILYSIKAWELYRLAKKMRTETVRFAYEKTDGSIRYAEGTLMNLPAGATVRGKRITKPSYKTFAYF